MARLLNRLKLWQRFALLGLMALLLVSPPFYLFVTENNKNIAFSSAEQSGRVEHRAVVFRLDDGLGPGLSHPAGYPVPDSGVSRGEP